MLIYYSLLFSLFLSSGAELELSGDFVEAGRAYYEDNDTAGESRILTGFLEEALYSGSNTHAFDLLLQLECFPIESSCFDFWYARLSWNCGLSEFACMTLDSIHGSRWLESRAKGLAAQFRGNGNSAAEYFRLSIDLAASTRQRFYSALDLSFALVQTGRYEEAEDIAVFLSSCFPGEGLPVISLALSLHEQNRFGESMSILQSLYRGDKYTSITKHFAATLLEDLE